MPFIRPSLLLACASLAIAVESPSSSDMQPRSASQSALSDRDPRLFPGAPVPLPAMRNPLAYEVEVLVYKPNDAESLKAWVQLGAIGYHVVGAIPVHDGIHLFLERTAQRDQYTLPAVLEENKDVAEPLRARMLSNITARQQAVVPPAVPPPAPSALPAKPFPDLRK